MIKKEWRGKSWDSIVDHTHDMLDSATISMKNLKVGSFRTLFLGACFGLLTFMQGCEAGSGADVPIADRQFSSLSAKTWQVQAVTLDGAAQEGYDAFTLVFSEYTDGSSFNYATANPPQVSPWPASGVCAFDLSDPATKIIRDPLVDKVSLSYSVSGGKLRISFTFSGVGYESAAVSNVRGNWVFDFI